MEFAKINGFFKILDGGLCALALNAQSPSYIQLSKLVAESDFTTKFTKDTKPFLYTVCIELRASWCSLWWKKIYGLDNKRPCPFSWDISNHLNLA